MDLNLKKITIGSYSLSLTKRLNAVEIQQQQAKQREEGAASRVKAIASNQQTIKEYEDHITEVEAGKWDFLLAWYQQRGDIVSRETRIADSRKHIEDCKRNIAYFEANPIRG